ncbi:MAG: hypothetical protein AAF587_40100 [Bacteroidota bacterium]
MQVAKLKEYIERYKVFLKQDREHFGVYRWESLRIFQQQWDVAAADFGQMYDQSLQNSQSKRLWKREAWYPKEMMLTFIQMDPDLVRSMFVSLFSEEIPVKTRIVSFRDDCDSLLDRHLKTANKPVGEDHFHGNNQMILLYLSFRYPEVYTLYDFPAFEQMMHLLKVANIPSPYELDRFVKLCQAMGKFLSTEEALLDLHQARLNPDQHYIEPCMLLVHDFYRTCVDL